MKKLFIITLAVLSIGLYSQAHYYSSSVSYTFTLPETFNEQDVTRQSTDYKLIDDKNRLIVLQTFPRTSAEKNIDAHDYTKEYLQETYQRNDAVTLVYHGEKIVVGGQRAFLAYYSDSTYPSKCEVTIYKDNNVHLFAIYTVMYGMNERIAIEEIFKDFLESVEFL